MNLTRQFFSAFCWAVCLVIWLVVFAAVSIGTSVAQADEASQSLDITVETFPNFHDEDHGQTEFGALSFLTGAVLTSDDGGFGGISGLRIDPDTGRFVGVTDVGDWLTGHVTFQGMAGPRFSDVQRAPLRDEAGQVFEEKYYADAEGLDLLPDGSGVAVAFERDDRVMIYAGAAPLTQRSGRKLPVPEPMAALRENKGLEALVTRVRLDGQLEWIGLAEEMAADGRVPGFILREDGNDQFWLAGHDRFSVTDAGLLPNGDLIVLERFFSPLTGPRMALRRVDGDSITAGATVEGEVLLVADASTQIDNMEALSILPGPHDGVVGLVIVSDDNFNPLQRTVWLHFTYAYED